MKIATIRTYAIWIFTFILLAGCKHLVHLDRAQDAFSQGATLENAQRFNPAASLEGAENPGAIRQVSEQNLVTGSPEAYYNLAYTELNKALDSRGRLEKDSILPTALSLRALTEWKLGKPGEAIETADDTLTEMEKTGIELPRDKAVMTAMRGLVALDLGYQASVELQRIKDQSGTGNDASTRYQNAKEIYQDQIWGEEEGDGNIRYGLNRIKSARAIPGDSHPVQRYLVLSQMTGLKSWGDSIALLFDLSDQAGETDRAWLEAQYCEYRQWLEMLSEELSSLIGDTESASIVRSLNLLSEPGINCSQFSNNAEN